MRGWLRRCAYVLPGLVLVAIAGNQIRLAYTADLTPWKGGGFGMFASADRGVMRLIRIVAIARNGRERSLRPGRALREPILAAKLFPSEQRLTAVAEAVAARLPESGAAPEAIRVEFWKHEFDGDSAQLRPLKTRELLYRLDDAG